MHPHGEGGENLEPMTKTLCASFGNFKDLFIYFTKDTILKSLISNGDKIIARLGHPGARLMRIRELLFEYVYR